MDEPVDFDKPYKYSTSDARDHSSLDTFVPKPKYVPPWYQGPSIAVSLVIFLMYFGIIREENDMDEMIYKPNAAVKENLDTR